MTTWTRAYDLALQTAVALRCNIPESTKWDRKQYYYPDLPKNYQITQYALPLAENGYFEFEVNGETKKVRIIRAHLEEDAGKNLHDAPNITQVDLNRTGTPLLEIVTYPDIKNAFEAKAYLQQLRSIVQYLGISDANMEEGSFRADINISVKKKYIPNQRS